MGYNVMDIIDKSIKIEEKRKIIIKDVVAEDKALPAVKLISKVLYNQINERIKYYKELKEEIKNKELEEIDFRTYDRISFLMNEFNNRVYIEEITNVKDYLKFSLDLAKDKYSLFIDIQGRLFNNTNDTTTKTYEILSKIITNISKEIRTIENTIS